MSSVEKLNCEVAPLRRSCTVIELHCEGTSFLPPVFVLNDALIFKDFWLEASTFSYLSVIDLLTFWAYWFVRGLNCYLNVAWGPWKGALHE